MQELSRLIARFAFLCKSANLTFASGSTMKAPPPPDSTMMATNLGLTAQNVESQEDLDTRMLS